MKKTMTMTSIVGESIGNDVHRMYRMYKMYRMYIIYSNRNKKVVAKNTS